MINKNLYKEVVQNLPERLSDAAAEDELPLIIREQGSFMAGKTVKTELRFL